ncbi:MAG: endonuclease III domain-containing protein [Thermodesulfobacteriota bacterium]|jgi:endonuclease-3 related protein|nr:MAG: endonuclease III domain-containing protein [Thermodesulfobacteriota bacterium]
MSQPTLLKIYQSLLSAFGPQHWWPANTAEEVIFGAILAQNTTWENAKRAIAALKNTENLSFKKIPTINLEELADLIKSARFLNQKAKALKAVADYLGNTYNFDIEKMKKKPLGKLREELLNLYRIGPETADSILLYALEKPIFVIDAYTKRMFSQHGFMKSDDSYEAYQKFFMDNLPHNVQVYNEFHALIVHTGYLYCKPKPLCEECPLSHF